MRRRVRHGRIATSSQRATARPGSSRPSSAALPTSSGVQSKRGDQEVRVERPEARSQQSGRDVGRQPQSRREAAEQDDTRAALGQPCASADRRWASTDEAAHHRTSGAAGEVQQQVAEVDAGGARQHAGNEAEVAAGDEGAGSETGQVFTREGRERDGRAVVPWVISVRRLAPDLWRGTAAAGQVDETDLAAVTTTQLKLTVSASSRCMHGGVRVRRRPPWLA